MNLAGKDSQKLIIAALFFIMALGFGLRLYQLGDRDVWLDEAYSLEVAGRDGALEVIKRTTTDTHPPLYYLFLHYWLALGDSEFLIRLPSVLFNLLAILGTYLLGSCVFNKKAGLFAALLSSASPFQIFYSQEARMYPLLGATAIFSLYFFYRALEDGKLLFWITWALLAIASLYTHYYGLYLLPIYALFFVLARPGQGQSWKTFSFFLSLVILSFLPWIPTLISQIERGGRYWLGLPNMEGILRTLRYFLANNYSGADIDGFLPFFYAAVLFLLLLHQQADLRGKGLLPALYLAVPIVISYLVTKHLTPVFAYKYLIMASPAFYILLGGAFFPGNDFKPGKYLGWISGGLRMICLVLVFVIVTLSLNHYLTAESGKSVQEWRHSVAYINNVVTSKDAVVIHAWWMYMPFQYYYEGEAPWFALPLEDAEDLDTLLAGRKRVALVLSHDRGYDPGGIILQHLMEMYELVESQEFEGVRVLLLEEENKGN